jgi:hypothetical protein
MSAVKPIELTEHQMTATKQGRDTDDDYCDEREAARALPNHWRERDALAADAVHPRRCVHGVPLNVFCGRCEA